MVVSWTPLFVLFHVGPTTEPHKTFPKNSNDAIPGDGKREKSFSRTPSEPDGISGVHRLVIARRRRAAIPPCRFRSSAATPSQIGAMREARICPHLQAA